MSKGKTARDRVVNYVRAGLLTGDVNSRQHLVESDIAERLNVSRTPVREAFAHLEELGIVTRIPYKGCRINHFTEEQINDIYEVRKMLEPTAVKLAAPNMDESDIQQLEEINNRLLESVDNIDDYHRVGNEFHNALYGKSGNEELLRIISDLRFRTGFLQRGRWHYKEARLHSVRQHQAIIDALREGGDLASLVRQNIDYAKRGE